MAERGGTLALVGATVLPGDGPPVRGEAVVVRDGRISTVGGPLPSGAVKIDLSGATLLPGFVDTHVHVQFATPEAILAGGVTTVRDLGSPAAARMPYARSSLRLLTAGQILTPPGGYPSRSWGADGTAREVAGPDDAATAVGEQADQDASLIKVALENSGGRPLFDAGTLAAIVRAAHDRDRRVTAHVGTAEALALAVESGIDELAHLPLFDVSADEMAAAGRAGMAMVPTLAIRGPGARVASPVAAFLEAGGRVLYGTDLGNGGTEAGIMPAEVRALLDAGMSGLEIVAAATAGAADELGLAGVGRIAEGAVADLVAVDGDPLADPDAYARVRLVLSAGRPPT